MSASRVTESSEPLPVAGAAPPATNEFKSLFLSWFAWLAKIGSWFRVDLRNRNDALELRSLRPEFIPGAHGDYVDILVRELRKRDPARNIAVSGPYGSGKSSVLAEFRRRRRKREVVEVALGTIEQSTTAITSKSAKDERSGSSVVTEALQKEIVKRLLYSAKSSRLPRSQLNRIRTWNWARALWIAAGGAILIGGIAWIYKVPAPFAHLSQSWVKPPFQWFAMSVEDWIIVAHILDLALVFVLLVVAQWAVSLVRIHEVAVGEFKLTREDPAQNYFDQYLDEIVYFFASTKTRLVIFEDLDRFANKGIFVALRELNVLLNNADAVSYPVTFVYAIRDSVFSPKRSPKTSVGVVATATARAKFFDLIVPIVPFVSAEVSGGLLTDELASLDDCERPDPSLIRIAGQYFPDMRVLRSIRNEYELYFDRLIRKSKVELDRNHLFASLLYKHAYPDDYELIQFGSSRIDTLFASIEQGVLSRLSGMDHVIARMENAQTSGSAVAERAAVAGSRLSNALELVSGGSSRQGDLVGVSIGTARFTPEDLNSPKFWAHFDANPAADLELSFGNGNRTSASRAVLNNVLFEDIPANNWLVATKKSGHRELEQMKATRRALRHANLSERLTDRRFVGIGVSRGVEAEVDFLAEAREVLGDGFPLELAQSGFLDQDFPLYTSVYQDSQISSTAQTYRIQFVRRKLSSPLSPLTFSDIEEIRSKVGDGFLEEPSVLNVSIFDQLLDSGAIDAAVNLIARGELDEAREFSSVYLSNGEKPGLFVRKLAPNAEWVLELIASDENISEKRKLALFGPAIGALSRDVDYGATPEVKSLVSKVAQSSFKGFGRYLKRGAARAAAKLVAESGSRVPELSGLSHDARKAIGEAGAFVISQENLALLAGARGSVGLDSIGLSSPVTLRQLLNRWPDYIDVLDTMEPKGSSIDTGDDLLDLLQVIAEFGPEAVEKVLERSGVEIVLGELPGSDEDPSPELIAAYPAIARTGSMAPTAGNALRYVDVVGSVDDALVAFLVRHKVLDGIAGLPTAERLRLVDALVTSPTLPASLAAQLVKSIAPDKTLDPGRLVTDRPEVFAALLSRGIVADSVATFTSVLKLPWPVREAAFALSKKVESFVGEMLLDNETLSGILASSKVGESLKRKVLSTPALVSSITTKRGAELALRVARDQALPLVAAQVVGFLELGASHELVVAYLGAIGEAFSDQDLLVVLAALPSDFSVLASHSNSWRMFKPTSSLDKILKRLQAMGLVGKVTPQKNGNIRVSMRPS